MLYLIFSFLAVVLISMKELIGTKQRGKTMGIFFSLIGVSLLLGILMMMDKSPVSPNVVIVNVIKILGLEEG